MNEQEPEEESAPIFPSTLLEEEVKHHQQHFPVLFAFPEDERGSHKGHLIQDDDISVLAFITIFSPPPNRS